MDLEQCIVSKCAWARTIACVYVYTARSRYSRHRGVYDDVRFRACRFTRFSRLVYRQRRVYTLYSVFDIPPVHNMCHTTTQGVTTSVQCGVSRVSELFYSQYILRP